MVDINNIVSHETTITRQYSEGADKIYVTSSLELFGSLVQTAKVGDKMMITMVDPKRPLTIQTGGNACINVYHVANNELSVTPISVQVGGLAGDVVAFASSKSLPSNADGKLDFDKIKRQVDIIESMCVFQKKDAFHIEGTKQERAVEIMEDADKSFWEGIRAESLFNANRMFHCPVFDCTAETDYEARKFYTEALRKLNDCVTLDMTNYAFYSKRAASLCKLKLFDRALADAETYCIMRPQSPSGYCLRGACFYGMNDFASSIKELQKGLEIGSVAYYDSSRVWSTGTVIQDMLDLALVQMEKLSEAAKVANKQGLTWLDRGDYGHAIPKLHETMKLTSQSLGKEHLSYSVALNNLAACQEAMGNYDEALKNYLAALQLAEVASFGEITFFLISGRHMPNTCSSGVWSDGGWVAGALTCNPYVKVELFEKGVATFVQESKAIQGSHQPKWDQMMKMQAQNADCEIIFSLMSRNAHNQAIQKEIEELSKKIVTLKQFLEEAEQLIQSLQSKVDVLNSEISADEHARNKRKSPAEIESRKLAIFKLEREILDAKDEIQSTQMQSNELEKKRSALEIESQGTADKLIGKCSYSIRKLANTLHGKQTVFDKQWFTVIDENGRKIRGEDFGVTALQVEISWMPEDVEYASRLCNVGNIYRILGDTFSSRGGGGNDLKKLETYYVLAEQHLDSALKAMKQAKSKVQVEDDGFLKLAVSEPNKIKFVDGSKTLEYLTVLENLAVLHKSKGMEQRHPKGTSEATIAKMQAIWTKSRRRALELLQEALDLRSALCGPNTPECVLLLLHMVTVHWSMDNFREAFPIQEHITKLVKGDQNKQSDWTRQLGVLTELHIMLGDTRVEVHDDGSWSINASESWHWDMVSVLSKRVKRAAKAQTAACGDQEQELGEISAKLKAEKIHLYDPPVISDFRKVGLDDSLSLKVRETVETTMREQPAGEAKVARAVASKMKKPETQLVSTDTQLWPNRIVHTRGS